MGVKKLSPAMLKMLQEAVARGGSILCTYGGNSSAFFPQSLRTANWATVHALLARGMMEPIYHTGHGANVKPAISHYEVTEAGRAALVQEKSDAN